MQASEGLSSSLCIKQLDEVGTCHFARLILNFVICKMKDSA